MEDQARPPDHRIQMAIQDHLALTAGDHRLLLGPLERQDLHRRETSPHPNLIHNPTQEVDRREIVLRPTRIPNRIRDADRRKIVPATNSNPPTVPDPRIPPWARPDRGGSRGNGGPRIPDWGGPRPVPRPPRVPGGPVGPPVPVRPDADQPPRESNMHNWVPHPQLSDLRGPAVEYIWNQRMPEHLQLNPPPRPETPVWDENLPYPGDDMQLVEPILETQEEWNKFLLDHYTSTGKAWKQSYPLTPRNLYIRRIRNLKKLPIPFSIPLPLNYTKDEDTKGHEDTKKHNEQATIVIREDMFNIEAYTEHLRLFYRHYALFPATCLLNATNSGEKDIRNAAILTSLEQVDPSPSWRDILEDTKCRKAQSRYQMLLSRLGLAALYIFALDPFLKHIYTFIHTQSNTIRFPPFH